MIDVTASLSEMSRALRAGEISARELTEQYLQRIAQHDRVLRAFEIVTRERALAEAALADREQNQGKSRGPLHGIPFAVKDVINVEGEVTGLGLAGLDRAPAKTDAPVVRRLRDAGMVLLGKTRSSALASDVTGLGGGGPVAHNPWKKEAYAPGGSSSGSAVAVAAALVPVALGTDTGGSIRVPAALCGVSGAKPVHDPVSLAGVHPLCPSLDTVGVIARSAYDAYAVLDVAFPPNAQNTHTQKLRLAKLQAPYVLTATAEVQMRYVDALALIADGHEKVGDLELPSDLNIDLSDMWKHFAFEAYMANVDFLCHPSARADAALEWIYDGKDVSLETWQRSAARRQRLIESMHAALQDIDVLALPTTPDPALPASALHGKLLTQSDRYAHNSLFCNFFDLPAVAVPIGFSHNGLPVGLTLCSKPGDSWMLRSVAAAYQKATSWHLRLPDLT